MTRRTDGRRSDADGDVTVTRAADRRATERAMEPDPAHRGSLLTAAPVSLGGWV